MNPWQLAQQIKHELSLLRWQQGSADLVFGSRSVFVFAGVPPSDETMPAGFPFALISLDEATADDDEPSLLLQTVSVVSVVEAYGDELGEFAVIGGARPDLGKSAGAGIAEVSERVRYALQNVTAYDGASIQVSAQGMSAPQPLGKGRHLAYDQLTVQALCTSQPLWSAPQQVSYANGIFRWAGQQCSSRFDFVGYRLGYQVGSTPTGAWTAVGDVVMYEEIAHTPQPQRVYSVRAQYDPRATGAATEQSDADARGAYVAL